MDGTVLSVLEKEIRLTKKVHLRVFDLLFLAGVTLAGAVVRLALFNIVSGDYNDFLQHWYDELAAAPGFSALGLSVGNYNVPYLYLMKLMTLLPMNALYAIKLFSCVFDFLAAVLLARMVHTLTANKTYALGAYAVALFAPTVVLNGAAWGQCDVIYTFFLLLCTYALIKNRPLAACVWFGVSFSFKLQAVFILPLLVWLWLAGRVKLKHFLAIPAVYAVFLLPAALADRPLGELLSIYLTQTGTYSAHLTMNYPNLYVMMKGAYTSELAGAGIGMAVGAVGLLLYFLHRVGTRPTPRLIVSVALLSSMVMPFFLPYMHERYGFVADMLVLVYLFARPSRWPAAVGVTLVSLCAYAPFLFGCEPVPFAVLAGVNLLCIAYVAVDVARQCLAQGHTAQTVATGA